MPVLIMAFGIAACTENAPEAPEQLPFQPELLIGEWTITAVYKSNGDKINSVSDGSFDFQEETVTINLAGFPGIENGVPMDYSLKDKTVSEVGEFKIDFEITTLRDSNLVMNSDIRGMKLEFELEK